MLRQDEERDRSPAAEHGAADERVFDGSEIAIIGMACRFPGASTIETFWHNLQQGVESLIELERDELLAAGVSPELIEDPSYVRRASVIRGVEDFDARFFGYTPLEATIMDPQHRLFLETAWEVLEQGGYDPERYERPIGVFTGAKTNTYLFNVVAQRHRFPTLDNFQIALGNDLAAMATRVSYKFDLRGPSYALHTACSTSLVAVHLACQSLLLDECSMAIAGGASINVPQSKGYPYQKGGILSPDGSCRTFDADAAGSNFGNGVGAVLLKRLEDAIADGDHVYALIRGSATNNDGASKASFTAPGVEGQTAVLVEAMAVAGVGAEEISYIEAHGTATDLGDSIEMLALTEAFRASTDQKGFCAIGSAKTNLGHLETAAGVAGLIKTALALEHRELPPSLHFERPNPKIDFASSPFEVNTERRPWPAPQPGKRRLAGVSSFGIGSTNAHVILEEPPEPATSDPDRPWQLLLLSARTETARQTITTNLGSHLAEHRELALADVAFTLAMGRKPFEHRRFVVARDAAEAIEILSAERHEGLRDATLERGNRRMVFLFPGLGEHYVEMGIGLYQREPVFRAALDEVAEALRPHLDADIREILFPRGSEASEHVGGGRGELNLRAMLGRGESASQGGSAEPHEAEARLEQTRYTQPAIFAVEVALARLLGSRGVKPAAMIGYSLGEYVCAHLSGVLSLVDACRLVARRAKLIDGLTSGSMLAVTLGEQEIRPLLAERGLSLAAVNGSVGCVASGTVEKISAFASFLAEEGIASRSLPTTHAFHSDMMQPITGGLEQLVAELTLSPPEIPYVSNVTGTWITAEEAMDPTYWVRHLTSPVRFADALGTALEEGDRAFLEVGPGQSLASFTKLHPGCGKGRPVISTMRARYGETTAAAAFLGALGELWLAGVEIDWRAHYAAETRRRVPLPTYPFERQRCWLDPDLQTLARTEGRTLDEETTSGGQAGAPAKIADLESWLYRQVWSPAEWPDAAAEDSRGLWLLLAGTEDIEDGIAGSLVDLLRERGAEVVLAAPGPGFQHVAGGPRGDVYRLCPGETADYEKLLKRLAGRPVKRIVHLLTAAPVTDAASDEADFRAAQELGFYSLIALVQALGRQQAMTSGLEIDIVSHGVHEVETGDPLAPERSTILGPAVVIPQEHPNVLVRAIDIERTDVGVAAARLMRELVDGVEDVLVVHRGDERRVRTYERMAMPSAEDAFSFRPEGVYLITGGLGGIGLALAEHLAASVQARLVLTRRTPLPPREAWDAWLEEHGPGEGEEADKTSRAIVRIRGLEAQGAEVLVAAADVADEAAMRAVIDQAAARFGTVHGVIHAAGVLAQDSFKTVQLTGRDEIELHFGPKVYGLYVLERVLEGFELDFVTAYSSLSAILGGLGYVGYATANLFMDYFTARHNQQGGAVWQSVDWDSWHYQEDEASRGGLGTTLSELAMSPAEGVETLRRLLAVESPRQLVISTGELEPRLAQWVELRALRATASVDEAGATRARRAAKQLSAGEELEQQITEVWRRVLGVEELGREDNFFDIGGNSLLGMQLIAELGQDFGVEVEPVALFESPTVAAMARFLSPEAASEAAPKQRFRRRTDHEDIAVIGLEGRFPGADSASDFWHNLRAGRETISFFSDEELRTAGVDEATLNDPQYVKARPILEAIESFDAPFFGYTPREAEIMDPQHRVFLEAAWAAFENAGYDIESYDGAVGVYAGASISSYMANLYSNPELVDAVGTFQTLIGNEKDSLTTKVSYKFDLRGPSLAVQTFCSTSLVAVHLACQALLNGECDMALAGGVSIIVPQVSGYRYEKGGIGSIDGHIRAFDAEGSGIVFGNGLGAVVLKRLDEALADGDPVRAVIKATAINNDGSGKAGYSATSVEGQSEVVAAALEISGVDPETIGYMEAHGTGTPLGDPIEMAALNKAFKPHTDKRLFCPIGSAKTNVGHLDRAAGVTGLIKTVLAIEQGEIPPSLHFETPNPAIDFEDNAFYVATELTPWPEADGPRRAGVNSLGLGGTNAHAILEQAPVIEPSAPGAPWQLLPLSARTETALERMTDRFADHLDRHPEQALADVAYTLQLGRKAFGRRRIVVAPNGEHASAGEALRERRGQQIYSGQAGEKPPRVVFLFPGLGGQYMDMGRDLYDSQPVFREVVDRCAEVLQRGLGFDLREILYPEKTDAEPPGSAPDAGAKPALDLRRMLGRGAAASDAVDPETSRLDETAVAQPVLFTIEVALATLVQSWGVEPQAMVGYSLGEYAAACVGGILELEDALKLVARRAQLIQELEAGAMLAVPLTAAAVEERLVAEGSGGELSLAAVNGPEQSVVAGPVPAVEAFAQALADEGVVSRRLQTTHAFHSSMMDRVTEPFLEVLRDVELGAPKIPWLSNVTGDWMTEEEASDVTYWARHTRSTVRFSESLEALAEDGDAVFLELGPGQTLGSLALQHPAFTRGQRPTVVAAMRHNYEPRPDLAHLLESVGRLWLEGVEVDWLALHGGARRLRVPLPSYAFDRQNYWVESAVHGYTGLARIAVETEGAEDVTREGAVVYRPSWRRARSPQHHDPAVLAERLDPALERWLLLVDEGDGGVGAALVEGLRSLGRTVDVVAPGADFETTGGGAWTVRPGDRGDAEAMLEAMDGAPQALVCLWSLAAPEDETLEAARERGLDGLLAIVRALDGPLSVWTVSAAAHEVTGDEPLQPGAATILAATRVLPRERPATICRSIDVLPPSNGSAAVLGSRLLAEIADAPLDETVAYRGSYRWVPTVEPIAVGESPSKLRDEGAYLVTGGLDSRGFAFASFLARRCQRVRLALLQPPITPTEDRSQQARRERDDRRRAALVEAGAEVLDLVVDLADPEALERATETVTARFGQIHGVVHAAEPASVEEAYVTIDEAGAAGASAAGQALLGLRGEGARQLSTALDNACSEPLDFAFALSSAAALVGGLGLIYDAASGFYLDAYAGRQERFAGASWTSVAWDFFLDDEDNVRSAGVVERRCSAEGAACSTLPGALPATGATPAEERNRALQEVALDVLFGLLPATQLIATPRSLASLNRLEVVADPIEEAADEGPVRVGGSYPRPALSTAYVEPSTETERQLAEIWQAMLGVTPVGIQDGFLELGGDSLLAARLVARMREVFEVDLPVRLFFEATTVEQLAREVETRLAEAATEESEELADLIAMLDGLSEEEVEAELARRMGGGVMQEVDP